jgi:transcription elongation regulator 1
MASLREREEQVRMEKLRTARNTEQARGAMGREEGEREFKMLLIDVVRGHDVSRFLSVVGCH